MRHLSALFPRIILSLGAVPITLACGGAVASSDLFDDSDAGNDASSDARKPPPDACRTTQFTCSDGVKLHPDSQEFARRSESCSAPGAVLAGTCSSSCGESISYCSLDRGWDPNTCGEGGGRLQNGCSLVDRQVPCGVPMKEGTTLDAAACNGYCGKSPNAFDTYCVVTSGGLESGYVLRCEPMCGVGRRPSGLVEQKARGAHAIGRHLAKLVELEAASIDAFEILRSELAHYGAPSKLLRKIEIARRDEIRHARTMAKLTRGRRGVPITPRVDRPEVVRPLLSVALENAIEGCVRETFGALVAHYQAEHAQDPEIRAAMKGIARDETQHAELSFTLLDWMNERLDEEGRRAVDAAIADTFRGLVEETPVVEEEIVQALGLPSPDVRRQLLDRLADEVLPQQALSGAA